MHKRMLALLIALFIALFMGICSAEAQVLELSGKDVQKDANAVIDLIRQTEDAERVIFDQSVISPENLQLLHEAFPELEMEYSVSVLGKRVRSTAEEINLYKTPVNGGKDFEKLMAALPWLPKLREIRALDSSFTYEEMERIHAALPDVHVYAKLRVNKHYVRTDVTAFSTRHSKTSTRYSSDDMRNLKYIDQLLALDIGHNAVDDLSFLYDLPELRILILADNDITDLTPIASLKNLEYLELFLNPITDLSPLAELENLIDLHVGECEISDFSPLYGLQKLDRLWISDNPYTEEEIERLRRALPNATINTTASQIATTAEGWRQGHPRYLTIVDIFEKSKYKEFDP